jgi:hypothetical protein
VRLERLPPEARARRLAGWLAAPVAGGAALTLACFLPAAGQLVGLGADHCLRHDDEHVHFCFVHAPTVARVAALALGAWLALLIAALRDAGRVKRLGQTLGAGARTKGDIGHVATPKAFALTVGLFRPRVFVSDGLVAALPAELLAAVVAHERCHAARRDPLWRWALGWLSRLHLPSLRRRLFTAYVRASEEACDAAAARDVGDPVRVAAALVAVARLQSHPGGAAAAMAASDVEARVERLLADRPSGRVRRWPLLGVGLLTLLLLADPLHHLTETLLGPLLR